MSLLIFVLILQLPAVTWDSVTVARVIDGDTFVTSDSVHVRLIGVDTPELRTRDKAEKRAAFKARAYIDSLLRGRRIRLEYEPGKRMNFYGRTLAYVYIDSMMVNKELIRWKLGKLYLKYPFCRSKEFTTIE